MNIVCFSYNAPPQNDPEAFCTARFLSSLAQGGVNVHLVTMDHGPGIDAELVSFFLNHRIKVTRIPIEKPRLIIRAVSNVRYRYHGPFAHQLSRCISTVNRVLRTYEKPILLTRSYPVISNIVGYYCQRNVEHWMAHFGDPYPGFGMYSRRHLWKYYADLWWARKICNRSSLITVTCRNANRWFCDTLKMDISPKVEVVPHIGLPHLTEKHFSSISSSKVTFSHVGFWSERRSLTSVLSEFHAAHTLNSNIRLEQHGPMDVSSFDYKRDVNYAYFSAYINEALSPRAASLILSQADINIVIDQDDQLSYCPYLASKFAYAVAAGRPILAIGQADSEMSRLYAEIEGFYFCDIRLKGALRQTLLSIASSPGDSWVCPNEALIKAFSPETIANKFLLRVSDLLAQGK